jgi:hypothetical protein
VVQIGSSTPASNLKLVAQPNDWGKQVKAATGAGALTERSKLCWDFWEKFLNRAGTEHPGWTKEKHRNASYGTTCLPARAGLPTQPPSVNKVSGSSFTSGVPMPASTGPVRCTPCDHFGRRIARTGEPAARQRIGRQACGLARWTRRRMRNRASGPARNRRVNPDGRVMPASAAAAPFLCQALES